MPTKCDFNGNNECHLSHQTREICDYRGENYCFYPKDMRDGKKDGRTNRS